VISLTQARKECDFSCFQRMFDRHGSRLPTAERETEDLRARSRQTRQGLSGMIRLSREVPRQFDSSGPALAPKSRPHRETAVGRHGFESRMTPGNGFAIEALDVRLRLGN
jgi:hypothetical protein